MATQPEVVRQSDWLNQLVIDRNTMEELGKVDVLWMHPPVHRVLGFICKSGFMGTKKMAFNLAQIKTFGANSILVGSQPVETDAEKVRQLESLIHCEVWSDAGEKIGRIVDCLFNLQTGTITDYLFVTDNWGAIAGTIYLLPPSKILSFGRKRVLISEQSPDAFAVYREGIQQKVGKVKETLQQNYSHATQELQSFTQQAKTASEQARERARILAEQAKERAQILSEQLQEQSEELKNQAKEKGQTWVEQVKEQAQTIGEQVRERTQTLAERWREELDPVTEPPPVARPRLELKGDAIDVQATRVEDDSVRVPEDHSVRVSEELDDQPWITDEPRIEDDSAWVLDDLDDLEDQPWIGDELPTDQPQAAKPEPKKPAIAELDDDDDEPWI